MGVNSLPKTVTRQRRGCDLNPGPTAPEPSTLTTRIPSHPSMKDVHKILVPPRPPKSTFAPTPPPYGRPLHMVTLQHSVPVTRYQYLWSVQPVHVKIDLLLF